LTPSSRREHCTTRAASAGSGRCHGGGAQRGAEDVATKTDIKLLDTTLAERYGADTAVRDWHKRLVCSRCGGREIDFVLTGARR